MSSDAKVTTKREKGTGDDEEFPKKAREVHLTFVFSLFPDATRYIARGYVKGWPIVPKSVSSPGQQSVYSQVISI
jgi:hypothetical protein